MDHKPEQANPTFITPMLLRRVQELPDGPAWQYEVKWDGYRLQAVKCRGRVRLWSRNGADYTDRFPTVAKAVQALRPATIHLDGELVAMDSQGRPSFQVLQDKHPIPDGFTIGYYAFDLLCLGRKKLTSMRLQERRTRLQEVLAGSGLRFSGQLQGRPEDVVNAVREHGLEGIVAKRLDSPYEPGKRSGCWVKLPVKST